MKILIVEDDQSICQFLRDGFESEGDSVDISLDGQTGSYKARTGSYDVIVLDHSLPHKNGLEICKEIRSIGSSVPVIFLSVVGDTKIKIDALSSGADDYLTKPFSFEELKARIKALLRRPKKIENQILTLDELSIDLQSKLAYKYGNMISLTRKEYDLLEYLLKNRGQIVSRSMIMEHVWSADSDPFSNTIETHILNLRKKINGDRKRDFIKNMPGRGYSIEV